MDVVVVVVNVLTMLGRNPHWLVPVGLLLQIAGGSGSVVAGVAPGSGSGSCRDHHLGHAGAEASWSVGRHRMSRSQGGPLRCKTDEYEELVERDDREVYIRPTDRLRVDQRLEHLRWGDQALRLDGG